MKYRGEKQVNKSALFRLDRSGGLIVALTYAIFIGEAIGAAGRVDFATDGATVSGANGQQRALRRGTELDKGDTIRTDANARAQIRFADGAYISLQPNTEFAIKDYNFDGKADGTERSFFALAKGAMRTVTGLIGRVNRNRYQIATPTATIGIRGTGGLISIGTDGSTLVNGTSGIWTITNPAGTIDVPAGSTGKAPAAPNQPPQQTTEKPALGPSQPLTTQPPYMQADNRAPDGAFNSVGLKSGPGYTALTAYSLNGAAGTLGLVDNGNAAFNGAGQMTSAALPGVLTAFTLPSGFSLLDGAHGDFGTDGIVAWGRWIGTVMVACDPAFPCTTIVTFDANQGLHYVVGAPTAVLPTTGTGVAYNLLGATRPTYVDGSTTPGTFTGSLNVTFAPGAARVGMTFDIAMPDGRAYAYNGSGTATSATFSMSGTVTSPTSCVAAGCSANVIGTFFGPGAERVGTSYLVQDVGASKQIVGAAAFQKQ
jgi:hypothetical protein